MNLTTGSKEKERLEITVFGYEREHVGEYYDDNWLNCYLELAFGGFNGKFELSLLTRYFIDLLPQVENLYSALKGVTKFESMEQQLEFTLTGNGNGVIELKGDAMDMAGPTNQLYFYSEIDQTYLPEIILQLKQLIRKYPERAQ